jgi:hypothetical protein
MINIRSLSKSLLLSSVLARCVSLSLLCFLQLCAPFPRLIIPYIRHHL